MNQVLQVKIDADIDNLKKGLSESEKALKSLENSISSVQKELKQSVVISRGYEKAQKDLAKEFKLGTISQSQYDKGLKNLQRDEKESAIATRNLRNELNSLKRSYVDAGGSTKNLTGNVQGLGKATSSNAVPAMTSFSQVIQDAPYGIQGVANNIQQLTMQMGYLSKGAGGMTGAMRAMASSLVGPAGILLAVSLVTTLLVTYGDKLSFAASKTKELAKAMADHVSKAKTEIGTLKQLVGIATDYTQSIVTRRNAIKEINDKYGEYLGNLDEESIKTDKVKDAIDRLTLSLIQQAKIRGLEDLITDKTKDSAGELLDLELRKRDAFKSVQQELKKLQGTNYFSKVIKDSNTVQENLDAVQKSTQGLDYAQLRLLKSAVASYKGLKSEISDVQGETDKALAPLLSMQSDLRAQDLGFSLVPEFDQDDVVIKGGGKDIKIPVKADPHNVDILDLENDTAELSTFLDKFLDTDAKINEAIGAAQYEFRLNEAWEGEIDELKAQQDAWLESQKLFADQQAEIMGVINSGVSNMLQSVASDLEEGKLTFESFAKSLRQIVLKIVATVLAQSIAQAIQGATTAAAATGPAAPFVLPGLIGGATAVVAGAFSSLPAFASGGIVSGNSYSGDKVLARLNSGELVLNKMQQEQMRGMMTPSMRSYNEGSVFIPETRIAGSDIIIAYNRAESKNKRYS